MRGVVFLEERTAEAFASAIAVRLGLTDRLTFVPHEGKSDLDRSFPRKIPAWRYPSDARFVIVRDNDGADCRQLKQRLLEKVGTPYRDRVKIRIVMQELEAWYLGDLDAVEAAGFLSAGQAQRLKASTDYRTPEALLQSKQTFMKLVNRRSTIEIASEVGRCANLENNLCAGFRYFLDALRWAAQ